jgi:deazaflavin-dependent oxidoreductase (nitroreductase family)
MNLFNQLIDGSAILREINDPQEDTSMAVSTKSETRVPSFVGLFNPIARRLLGAGVPMGPNALITVRGRKSGEPRTTPVALVEIDGKRWVIGTFGQTHWVRNLRAAGEATITVGKRQESVSATELTEPETAAFLSDVLVPFVRHIPLGLGSFMIGTVLGARDIIEDPVASAPQHPVFEIHGRAA